MKVVGFQSFKSLPIVYYDRNLNYDWALSSTKIRVEPKAQLYLFLR